VDRFAERLLCWFARYGRHDLPWQRNPSPYSIWVAEIMLQQTQVKTVIPYYERFIARFPSLRALAEAELDELLGLWSGLGYYARARNLHHAARHVVDAFGGELPRDLESLMSLPGIGRSTAGAILAQAHGLREPILDGNVKRVLCRYHGIDGWPGQTAVSHALWQRAEEHTPKRELRSYTQAIMDLGATVCTRSRPACGECPLCDDCVAARDGRQRELPAARPRKIRPQRRVRVLLIRDAKQRVLLERRPASGVWGGLFSLPELAQEDDERAWCGRMLNARVTALMVLPAVDHAFTHFDLEISPTLVELEQDSVAVMDRPDWLWYKPAMKQRLGLAAPIAALLDTVSSTEEALR
jgi:A/G-specific adenine glycosylase